MLIMLKRRNFFTFEMFYFFVFAFAEAAENNIDSSYPAATESVLLCCEKICKNTLHRTNFSSSWLQYTTRFDQIKKRLKVKDDIENKFDEIGTFMLSLMFLDYLDKKARCLSLSFFAKRKQLPCENWKKNAALFLKLSRQLQAVKKNPCRVIILQHEDPLVVDNYIFSSALKKTHISVISGRYLDFRNQFIKSFEKYLEVFCWANAVHIPGSRFCYYLSNMKDLPTFGSFGFSLLTNMWFQARNEKMKQDVKKLTVFRFLNPDLDDGEFFKSFCFTYPQIAFYLLPIIRDTHSGLWPNEIDVVTEHLKTLGLLDSYTFL